MRTALCLLSLVGLLGAQAAPTVSLNGSLGRSAALLVIGGQVKTLRVGESIDGIKLIEVGDNRAVVEIDGKRQDLRLGAATVAQGGGGGPAKGQRIVLQAGSGGHFQALGSINGHAMRFLVDTGATTVSISKRDADRMRIRYTTGQPVQLQTANGVISGHLITLDRVRLGDVEISGVQATVADRDMPFALLGNSFLSRFNMKRDNETLILDRRF
ncbi:MAG: TIGR02281 family clan AA aspartic protease [Burkholderiales bacterium]